VPVHREGIRTARARGDLDSLMWNYFGLGVSLAELGHMAEAEAAARRGLDVARAKGASTNIRLLMQSLGGVQVKRRRWQEAQPARRPTFRAKSRWRCSAARHHLQR